VPPTILEQLVDESVKLRERTKVIYRDAVERFLVFAGRDPRRWNGTVVIAWRQQLGSTVSREGIGTGAAPVVGSCAALTSESLGVTRVADQRRRGRRIKSRGSWQHR
jgi:hypothetical protein